MLTHLPFSKLTRGCVPLGLCRSCFLSLESPCPSRPGELLLLTFLALVEALPPLPWVPKPLFSSPHLFILLLVCGGHIPITAPKLFCSSTLLEPRCSRLQHSEEKCNQCPIQRALLSSLFIGFSSPSISGSSRVGGGEGHSRVLESLLPLAVWPVRQLVID